jgi:transposase
VRNVVEPTICRLKLFRRLATRYEERVLNHLVFLQLAANALWLQ